MRPRPLNCNTAIPMSTFLIVLVSWLVFHVLSQSVDVSEDSKAMQSACDVCTYVLKNKADGQPYLCRGLKDKTFQDQCVKVLESMMWWLENQVYWNNFGCQMSSKPDWLRPCPAHVICGWLKPLDNPEKTFCPTDENFQKPG